MTVPYRYLDSYAAEGAGYLQVEFLVFLFGVVYAVGVQLVEHSLVGAVYKVLDVHVFIVQPVHGFYKEL